MVRSDIVLKEKRWMNLNRHLFQRGILSFPTVQDLENLV